jgi:hypothetical protein
MKFELDISNLELGSVVEQSTCESILGVKHTSTQYAFLLMQLCDYVQKNLWADGKEWTVVSENGSLKVLTHEQASKYNTSRFNGGLKKLYRCHKRLMSVDVGQFDDELREQHNKSLIRTSKILQAIKGTRATLVLKPALVLMPKRT